MNFLDGLYERASKLGKVIALAEGEDFRVAKAAEILTKKRILNMTETIINGISFQKKIMMTIQPIMKRLLS